MSEEVKLKPCPFCGGECENTEAYFECFMDDEHPGWRSK